MRHCADEADPATPGFEAEAALAGLVEVPGVVDGSSISLLTDPAAAGRVDEGRNHATAKRSSTRMSVTTTTAASR